MILKNKIQYSLLLFLTISCSTSREIVKNEQVIMRYNSNISLIESFEKDSYEKLNSIMFYYIGNPELNVYYETLSENLNFRLDRQSFNYDYLIELDPLKKQSIKSFDELNLTFNDSSFDAACVFYFGSSDKKSIGKKTGYDPNRIQFHTLFMLLIESGTNEVIMKKRFEVKSKLTVVTENTRLSSAIVKELKIEK